MSTSSHWFRRLATVTLMLGVLAGCAKSPTSASDTTSADNASSLAQPTAKTTCKELSTGQSLVATAKNVGDLAIYADPSDAAPSQTMANPRLINNDPNAKSPLTFLVKDIPESQKCKWVQVYLPVRPNGSTGWVKQSDVENAINDYRIEVSLDGFTLNVFKDGKQVQDIPIGVARDNTPTPGGMYYTTELIKTPDPQGAYGPYAFGLSGFSDTLTTFNGGPGQLGIHGTNEPSAIGTKVSHGCIRMDNANITKLAKTIPLGTPVIIAA
ncbi:MAG: L,D-transpeptidase [Actinomycetes bacterium]